MCQSVLCVLPLKELDAIPRKPRRGSFQTACKAATFLGSWVHSISSLPQLKESTTELLNYYARSFQDNLFLGLNAGKVLGDWLTAEVAVCCCLLVLWLAQCQRLSDGTRTAIELNPDITVSFNFVCCGYGIGCTADVNYMSQTFQSETCVLYGTMMYHVVLSSKQILLLSDCLFKKRADIISNGSIRTPICFVCVVSTRQAVKDLC